MNFDELKNRMIIISTVIIASVLLLLMDSIGAVSGAYNVVSVVFVPIRLELRKVSVGVNDWIGVLSQVSSLKQENSSLKEENQEYLEKLSELDEYKAENKELKKQLKLDTKKYELLAEGRIIGNEVSQNNSIQINLGEKDGVKQGDIVVIGDFAVGSISRVDRNISKVTLITSPTSNIPARGQSNRSTGLVRGEVGQTLRMIDMLPDERIEEQEIVVTSGVESEFPAGLILGKVASVESNPAQATQEAIIEIQIDFSTLDYIFVIRGQES